MLVFSWGPPGGWAPESRASPQDVSGTGAHRLCALSARVPGVRRERGRTHGADAEVSASRGRCSSPSRSQLDHYGPALSPDGAGAWLVCLVSTPPHAAGPGSTWVRAPSPAQPRAPLSSLTRSDDASQAAHPPVRSLLEAPSGANGKVPEPLTP